MVLHFVVRTGVAVAVVMVTRHFGIWDTPERAEEIYECTTEAVEPYLNKASQRLGIQTPAPPPDGQWSFMGIYYYNQAVMAIFDFISMCPTYISQMLEEVPGIVERIVLAARGQLAAYRENRAQEKEVKTRQRCMDDRPMVQRVQPEEDCKCHKQPRAPSPNLVPKDAPASPYANESLIKPKETTPDCLCPECERREAEGWSDNKPKCFRREKQAELKRRQQLSEAEPEKSPSNEMPKKKSGECKICQEKKAKTASVQS